MNHCGCGARLDDKFLYADVGAAFCRSTPDGYGQIMLFRLPIREPIPLECSYSLGGGEYLNFATAEAWCGHSRPRTHHRGCYKGI